jgi:hypothetical protein
MGANWIEFLPRQLRRPDMPKTVEQLNADIARLTSAVATEKDAAKKQQLQRDLDTGQGRTRETSEAVTHPTAAGAAIPALFCLPSLSTVRLSQLCCIVCSGW